MSTYLMVSLQSEELNPLVKEESNETKMTRKIMRSHPWWKEGNSWKNILNNLRLFIEPLGYFNRLKTWLAVLFIPELISCFAFLFKVFTRLINRILQAVFPYHSYFSSS
jgi:hypothetical protein